MRGTLSAIVLGLLVPAAGAQVIATRSFTSEMQRAIALEAGATASDVPHHVHYDLKLYDHRHKLTQGTWDIWRDPMRWVRVDIVAGDFRYTHIEDLRHKVQWRHFNQYMPLKIYDLRQNFREPAVAVRMFTSQPLRQNVRFQQIGSSPFVCTDERSGSRICFDPLAHVLAFAQMYNQTVTWEDWQPLGRHSVPRRFQIYDGRNVIVDAAGQVDEVKTFPPDLFAIPAGEPDMGEPELDGAIPHRVVSEKAVNQQPLYGNVLVHVFAAEDGKVTKVELIDADDGDIVHDAMRFVKRLAFAPQMKDGTATVFDQYIYVGHAPGMQ